MVIGFFIYNPKTEKNLKGSFASYIPTEMAHYRININIAKNPENDEDINVTVGFRDIFGKIESNIDLIPKLD